MLLSHEILKSPSATGSALLLNPASWIEPHVFFRWHRYVAHKPKDRPEEAARAKAAGGNPTAFRCVEVNCVERSRACLAMGRTASMRRECVASVSGPTTPDSSDAVTSDDADQASVAVLSRHIDRKLACERLPAR